MIFHICTKSDWERAKKEGTYEAASFAAVGFTHCSTKNQVAAVANHLFKHVSDLVLLEIDSEKLASEIRYEDGGDGELYPHVYGPINTDSVIDVIDFPCNKGGVFELPETLRN